MPDFNLSENTEDSPKKYEDQLNGNDDNPFDTFDIVDSRLD